MNSLSSNQIKAARAWIEWSREKLAREAGVSAATVRNLEAGKIAYRSAASVRTALEKKGFKFYGTHGLKFAAAQSRTFEGPEASDEFYVDLMDTIKTKGGNVAALFTSYDLLKRALGVTDLSRTERIEHLTGLATVRCLLSDAHQMAPLTSLIQFRTTVRNPIGPLSQLLYGDKTAVIIGNGIEFIIHVIHSIETTSASFTDFDKQWMSAAPLGFLAAQPSMNSKK